MFFHLYTCGQTKQYVSQFNPDSHIFSLGRSYLIIDIHAGKAVHVDGSSSDAHERAMADVTGNYLKTAPNCHRFADYLQKDLGCIIDKQEKSSLHITVRCTSLKILENLWNDYISGALNQAAQRYLVTDDVLSKYNLQELTLVTFINEDEYKRCHAHLTELEGNNRANKKPLIYELSFTELHCMRNWACFH